MKRQPTQAAQVSKLCKQYLKSKGIVCSVRSDNYSMGNSVNVRVTNQPPEAIEDMKSEFSKYQSGHFDGMTDMYEYSNSRNDVPQTKYLFVENEITDDMYQKVWEFLCAKYPANAKGLPESYKDARNCQWYDNSRDTVECEVNCVLNGSRYGLSAEVSQEFWKSLKAPEVQSAPAREVALGIVVREGTRPGFSEIVFGDKPDQETRNSLKAARFRWSPTNKVWYGKTENLPAGF